MRQALAPWHILNVWPDPQGQGAFFGVDPSSSAVSVVPAAAPTSRCSMPPSAVGAV